MKDKTPKALKSLEGESQQALEHAEAIVETVPPLLVLDAKLRVRPNAWVRRSDSHRS